jgi:hypothetical protein
LISTVELERSPGAGLDCNARLLAAATITAFEARMAEMQA